MRRIALLAAMVSGFACGGSSSTKTFGATLVQSNEPTTFQLVKSSATGTASVQVAGNTLTYSLRATGLTAPPNVAHIHLTAQSQLSGGGPAQGAVIVTFSVAGQGTTVAVDATAATAPDVGAKNLDGTTMTFDDLVRHLQNSETYVNIHTGLAGNSKNPSGEIRGDLKPQ
jgi:CHRD domain